MTRKLEKNVGTSRNPGTVWTVPEPLQAVYCHAHEVRSGARLLFISGQFGVTPDGQAPEDFEQQCEEAMKNVERLLADSNMQLSDVVKLSYYIVRPDDASTLASVRRRRWASDNPPSVTMLVVSALAKPEYLVEIEAVAAV